MKFFAAGTLAFLTLCTASAAYAQQAPAGKTRAEVRAELIQAEQQGLVPASDGDYPPSAAEIERNRERYLIGHPNEQQTASNEATGNTAD